MKPGYAITKNKFLDRDQQDKLIKTCKDLADLDLLHGRRTWVGRYALVDLALFSGLRVSEISKLKIRDLNLKAKSPFLFVDKSKREKSRDVYLDKGIVKHLKEYISFKKKTLREAVDPEAFLFAGRNGNQITTTTLHISFKKAILKAGLPDHYSIHSARHTYGTYLLHKTGNLRFVQKQLGHSAITMTSLYADILPSENGKLADMIRDD